MNDWESLELPTLTHRRLRDDMTEKLQLSVITDLLIYTVVCKLINVKA